MSPVRSLLPLVFLTLVSSAACRDTSPPASGPTVSAAPPPGAQSPATAEPSTHERDERAELARQLEALDREGWYGVYMMGKKVGSGHLWLRRAGPDEPGVFTYGVAVTMAVSGGGNENQLAIEERRYYGTEYPHPLIETRFSSRARGFTEERVARPTPEGKMRITRTIGGAAEPAREVAGTRDDLLGQLRLSPLTLSEAEVGEAAQATLWSWEREADEAITVTLERIETRKRAGVDERVGVFDIRYEATGIGGKTLIADGGTMLEMSLGPALTLKLEERDVARGGVVGLEILGTGVRSPIKLGRPDAIDALRLEVTGPGELRLPASRAREVEALGAEGERGRWRLTLRRGFSDEVAPSERAEALADDATIDASHPAIVARMKTLTEGRADARDKVAAIADWVFRTLDKKLATHLPTASTVLDKQVGDCTEHTWLTVALLRAAQIPARPLYGIAYTGDAEAVFAYHAWVEVALEDEAGVERWLAIDPTWGEAEADATHIVLGKSLGEVAASIGGLVIERAEIIGPR